MSGKSSAAKKNLLLCFDAFGTLFTPNTPIPVVYARVAAKHGIDCGERDAPGAVGAQFKTALKEESKKHPNYGKATNLGAEKWWADVSHDLLYKLACSSTHLVKHVFNPRA